jgi:hypothetical protein
VVSKLWNATNPTLRLFGVIERFCSLNLVSEWQLRPMVSRKYRWITSRTASTNSFGLLWWWPLVNVCSKRSWSDPDSRWQSILPYSGSWSPFSAVKTGRILARNGFYFTSVFEENSEFYFCNV